MCLSVILTLQIRSGQVSGHINQPPRPSSVSGCSKCRFNTGNVRRPPLHKQCSSSLHRLFHTGAQSETKSESTFKTVSKFGLQSPENVLHSLSLESPAQHAICDFYLAHAISPKAFAYKALPLSDSSTQSLT